MRAAISLAGALWTMLASFRCSKVELSQSRAAGKRDLRPAGRARRRRLCWVARQPRDDRNDRRIADDPPRTLQRTPRGRPHRPVQRPAVARQVLQMPYQSVEQRRKRLHDSADDDRLLILVALHQGTSSAAPASNSTRASAAATVAASAWASPSPGRARASAAVCSANCWTSPTTG